MRLSTPVVLSFSQLALLVLVVSAYAFRDRVDRLTRTEARSATRRTELENLAAGLQEKLSDVDSRLREHLGCDERRRRDVRMAVESTKDLLRREHASAVAGIEDGRRKERLTWERELEAERGRRRKSDERITHLEKRPRTQDISAVRSRLTEVMRELSTAQSESTGLREHVDGMTAELRISRTQLDESKDRLQTAMRELADARRRLESERRGGDLRAELVGLVGPLDDVVFVVDSSSSMADDDRWISVVDTLENWLTHLPIQTAGLVTYATRPSVLKVDDRSVFPVTPENRGAMIRHMRSVKPGGGTNILAALERAYAIGDVDAIVLFSDGRQFDRRSMNRLQRLVRRHPGTHLHTVALGNYVARGGVFLRRLSKESGGAFLGR